ALDADSKLVPCFHVGKRNGANALTFMSKLQERVRMPVQITTDAFSGYPWAIGQSYGRGTHYARINKIYQTRQPGRGRYSPPWFVTVKKQVLWGNPRESRISTSYVERQNLTMRMQMRRFTRLTNAFSKKYDNLLAALNLHFCWYNFVRVHSSLKTTPAVAAGIESRPWKIEELIPTNGHNGTIS
ncbi:MAG: IS1 family transposase, partial [Candidatus Krumholzibacteria bacterium]